MGLINSYRSFSDEVGHLASTIDTTSSSKAVKKEMQAVFSRLASSIQVSEHQLLACNTKLEQLERRLQEANSQIETRCWQKMSKMRYVFSSIIWGITRVAKLWGGQGFRASGTLDVPRLTKLIQEAKSKFKISAQHVTRLPRKELPAPARIQVQISPQKAVLIAVSEAPKEHSLKDQKLANCTACKKAVEKLLKLIPEKRTPLHDTQKQFLDTMMQNLVKLEERLQAEQDPEVLQGIGIGSTPEEFSSSLLRHLKSIKQVRADCATNSESIKAALLQFPEQPRTLTEMLQKKHLEVMLKEQGDIVDSLTKINSEGLKITISPADIQTVIQTRLEKIRTLASRFETLSAKLAKVSPDKLPKEADSTRFRQTWADLHATLVAQLDSLKPAVTEANIRILPFQGKLLQDNEVANKISASCDALESLMIGITAKNLREKSRQLNELAQQISG